MKKALFVIAFENFQDSEYTIPLNILKNANIKTDTVSNKVGIAIGGYKQTQIKIKKTINQIDVNDYDAIVFIGGIGVLNNLDNKNSYRIIQTAFKLKKIIAAICIAPIILSNTGILKNKKATVWLGYSPDLKISTDQYLISNGALYQNKSVVIDDNIITANGPKAAQEFGKTILSLLVG